MIFFFWFVLDFSWSFSKKVRLKSSMAFQCQDWDTKFSYQIDYFWLFMKLQQKTWRNIYLHLMPRLWYNIVTLSSYIDFVLDFSWRISKKPGRNLYRLYYKKLLMSFQCRDIKYFTHCMGHCSLVGRFWNFLELFIP